jgi:aromatic ring hydroxylase
LTAGLMGRTPDYLNVTFAGFVGDAAAWRAFGNEAGAERLIAYQKHLRRADLSLTHAIVSPAADKALGDMSKPGDEITLRKISDTQEGIIVRGSRALATLAPFADEIAIYPRVPLPEGSQAYALCFCIPMSTPGLKFICRDSLSVQTDRFDYPLSSRFDEQDAFVIFDDVEVPRDRLFIDGYLGVFNSVMQTTWMPNIMQQTMIRAAVKLDFAWGLARRMAKTINAADGATEQMLGEIWSYAEFARSAIIAADAESYEHADGFWIPDVKPLYALRCMLPSWFPRVNEIISLREGEMQKNARPCSVSPGILSVPGLAAAMRNMNASISRPAPAICSAPTLLPTRTGRTGLSTAFSVIPPIRLWLPGLKFIDRR